MEADMDRFVRLEFIPTRLTTLRNDSLFSDAETIFVLRHFELNSITHASENHLRMFTPENTNGTD